MHRLRRLHHACEPVMDKLGLPRGLIRYTTERAGKTFFFEPGRCVMLTSARCLHGDIDANYCGGRLVSGDSSPTEVDVIRDRSVSAREADDGRVENVYNLRL